MNYNYHTHTNRCGHASGNVREYIERAIQGGITHMGFSDHVPVVYPGGFNTGYRVPVSQANEYFSEISRAREEYKDKIDIKIGFEMDYYPEIFESMLKNAISFGAEYLILGQHFTSPEINPDAFFVMKPHDDKEQLTKYADLIVEAINTGVFTYVAHPDAFYFTGDSDFYKEQMKKICITSKEKDIPVELNFLGIRDNRHYPNELFWQVAGEVGCPVVFGFDAHNPLSAFDNQSFARANELVNKFNLNYIGKPDIILIQEK